MMDKVIKDANDIINEVRDLRIENKKLSDIEKKISSRITGSGLITDENLINEKNLALNKINQNMITLEALYDEFLILKPYIDDDLFKSLLFKFGTVYAETANIKSMYDIKENSYELSCAINETTLRFKNAKYELEEIDDEDKRIFKSAEVEYFRKALMSNPEGNLRLELIEKMEEERKNCNNIKVEKKF